MHTSFILLICPFIILVLSLWVCSSCRSTFNLFSEKSWNDFSFCVSGGAASTRCWTCSPPSRKAASEESKSMWTGFRLGKSCVRLLSRQSMAMTDHLTCSLAVSSSSTRHLQVHHEKDSMTTGGMEACLPPSSFHFFSCLSHWNAKIFNPIEIFDTYIF